MGRTLTIRLEDKDREILEEAAKEEGIGLSSFIRQLAAAEAKRLWTAKVRQEFEEIAKYIASNPEAQAEIEDWGSADWEDLGDDEEFANWFK
jgi:hypothetical protein